MTGSHIEGFPMAPGGEGRTDLLLLLGRHDMESPPTSTMIISRLENPPTDQAMTTIPPWQETPQSDDNLPLKQRLTCRVATQ
jgi:hypothetical protein